MNYVSFLPAGIKALKAHIFKNYRTPLCAYIVLTERCPNKCLYCNYKNLNIENKDELATEDIINFIDQLHKLGLQKLHLSGGEPLVRNDTGEIINYAKSKGIFVGLSCNGVFVPERIGDLKNVDIVMLSLDGEEEVHDSLRGEGSFKQTMKAIDSLKKNSIKFWTTTVLNRMNLNSIDYILRLAEEKKIFSNFVILQYHRLSYKSNLPAGHNIKDIIPPSEDLRKALRYLIFKKRQGARIGSGYPYLNYLLEWEDYTKLFSSKAHKEVKCWAGKLYFHIDARGLIHACGLGFGIISGVEIKSVGLKKALYKIEKIPDCNSCLAACNIENNLIFSLSLNSIFNWLKKL